MALRPRPANLKALTLLAAGLIMACGVKGDPYPEATTLPGPVLNLTQTVTEEGVLILKWSPPETNMAGRPLKNLGGFQIEMADHLADEHFCAGCPPRYAPSPVDRVPAAAPPEGRNLAPGPYEWRLPLTLGHVYYLRVAATGQGGGAHPEAKTETVVWALEAPGALRLSAALGDRTVELSWPRPAAGYRAEIEKRPPEGVFQAPPGLDSAAGRFSDLDVAYGQVYEYRGRLIKVKDETGIQGPWTREIRIQVIDVTPPPAPTYLDAALAEGGIRLAWESLAGDPDLAGYRVYRRRPGEAEMSLITPVLLKDNLFFDREAAAGGGGVVQYQVTAVDGSPRANESPPSPVAEVRLERRGPAEP